jgi:hypothetical protein
LINDDDDGTEDGQTDEAQPMKLYLQLLHGRVDPSQDLQDWGSEGPVFGPLQYVHTTYAREVKFSYADKSEREGWLTVTKDDLLYYDGVYYGDWSAFTDLPTTYKARLADYDQSKAKLAEGTTHKPWYLLLIHGGIEPELLGPFASEEERDKQAQELHKRNDEDVILSLNSGTPAINVTDYSAGFLSGTFDQAE